MDGSDEGGIFFCMEVINKVIEKNALFTKEIMLMTIRIKIGIWYILMISYGQELYYDFFVKVWHNANS